MTDRSTEERKLAKELHWLEWMYYTSQLILAVIGILALVIYHGQLRAMQDSLVEMRSSSAQTDRLLFLNNSQLAQLTRQAQATQKLAEQAGLQAKATQDAIEIGKRQADTAEEAAKNTEADKRPWVTITPEDLPALPDEPNTNRYSFAFRLKNYGETPARNVKIACVVFPARMNTGPRIDASLKNYVQNNLHPVKKPPGGTPPPALNDLVMQAPLAPGQEGEVTEPWPTNHFPIATNYLRKLKDSHGAYYVQCKLLYDGSYGIQGETDSLWFVGDQTGPWGFITSEIGNDIH